MKNKNSPVDAREDQGLRVRAKVTTALSGEIFVQVRVSESHFESEIPGVFRNANLGKKIPENLKLFWRDP